MSLLRVWEDASAHPYYPLVGKTNHFYIACNLLLLALLFVGLFGLNRSLSNVFLLGAPASIAFGFGAVYMICAVGVYV